MAEIMNICGDNITAMLEGVGPVVACVQVSHDGVAKEVKLDMTPKKEEVSGALGGSVTFLGQWEPLGVFLLVRREDEGLPRFGGSLPKPFDAATGQFGGGVLMTRSLEDGTPSDFTLAEYEAFAAKAPEPWQEMSLESEGEEEEEAAGLEVIAEDDEDEDSEDSDDGWGNCEDDDSSDEDDEAYDSDAADDDERAAAAADEDDGELKDMLLATCLKKFEAAKGRPPTDEERAAIEAQVWSAEQGRARAEPGRALPRWRGPARPQQDACAASPSLSELNRNAKKTQKSSNSITRH